MADAAATLQKLHDTYAKDALDVDDTDGYSFEFAEWRFNIRMSNTEPVVRLNVESRGDSETMRRKTQEAVVVLVVFFAAALMVGDVAGRWSPAVRIALFSIGLLALVVFALSDRVRAQLAVLLKKHLMEPKFDYREEWLRLIETMTDESLDLSLDKRAIKSLAQIVPAESGQLWFRDAETNRFAAISASRLHRDLAMRLSNFFTSAKFCNCSIAHILLIIAVIFDTGIIIAVISVD